MGCIIDMIFELMVEIWFELMFLIIPKNRLRRKTVNLLKMLIGLITGILFVAIFIGTIAMIAGDDETKDFVRTPYFICLGISALQIISGIVLRIILNKKDNY